MCGNTVRSEDKTHKAKKTVKIPSLIRSILKTSSNVKIKCSLDCKINVPLKEPVANPAFYPRNSVKTIIHATVMVSPTTYENQFW